jgi:hypothetical protein
MSRLVSDRIVFEIPWDRFTLGTSLFIPCMNPTETLNSLRREALKHGVMFTYRIVVEKGVQGLRVWRI